MACLDYKVLADGSFLEIHAWISDAINPGKTMFQLSLIEGGASFNFPTEFEKYSVDKIKNWYNSINTKEDFHRIMKAETKK